MLIQAVFKVSSERMKGVTTFCFSLISMIAQILLHGTVILSLYWLFFGSEKNEDVKIEEDPEQLLKVHAFLMILGLVYFMGQGNLLFLLIS